jgi:hypothetical protein
MLPQVRARTPLAKRFRHVTLAFSLSVVAASTASAQRPRHGPDCNLAERRYDNPFADHSGWSMRRYQWHAFYAGMSTAAAEAIHRTTHLPRWASAVTATVGIGLIPHIRSGLVAKRYPFNPADWGFDLFDRAAPIFVWSGMSGGTWPSRTVAATTYLAGYAALACYASP